MENEVFTVRSVYSIGSYLEIILSNIFCLLFNFKIYIKAFVCILEEEFLDLIDSLKGVIIVIES